LNPSVFSRSRFLYADWTDLGRIYADRSSGIETGFSSIAFIFFLFF
jgi:hypothetical protein